MKLLQNLTELVINYIQILLGSFIPFNSLASLISHYNRLNPLIEVVGALKKTLGLDINLDFNTIRENQNENETKHLKLSRNRSHNDFDFHHSNGSFRSRPFHGFLQVGTV
jgi:hypothetical protein